MAVDEAIAHAVRRGGSPPTLRFYAWAVPSISIGYFQRVEEAVDLPRCREASIPLVRRLTGGKAVLHHREITYSVSAGVSLPGFRTIQETYLTLSRAIVFGIRALGIPAEILSAPPQPASSSPYCFAAASRHEIVVSGKKLIGSAQRRWREGFLQHGSILLSLDPSHLKFIRGADHSNGATSIEEILGGPVDPDRVRQSIIEGLEETLNIRTIRGDQTPRELSAADALEEKYRNGLAI
jgi:lipoate-protein ligase A